MKTFLKTAIIISGLILVLAACSHTSKPNNGGLETLGGLSTYSSEKYNFSVDYPIKWVQDNDKRPAGVVHAVRFDKVKDSKFPIRIKVWSKANKTLEQRKKEIEQQYTLKGANLAGYEKINWNRLIVNTKDNTSGFIFLLTERGNYLYEISTYGFENGIAVNDDIFSIIWSTFAFLDDK